MTPVRNRPNMIVVDDYEPESDCRYSDDCFAVNDFGARHKGFFMSTDTLSI